MNGNLKALQERLIKEKAKKQILETQLQTAKEKKETLEKRCDAAQKARTITQIIAEQLQKKIEFQISRLVTTALASVFPDPWEFQLRFVQRRNKTEADLIFVKNGKETDDILFSGGGGVADIAANIALPLAIWSIRKTRNLMLWDEPTKYLHNPEYQMNASALIKEVSEKLGIQILLVTDQKNLLNKADKIFTVENRKGISHVS